jgi:hypothetical protein
MKKLGSSYWIYLALMLALVLIKLTITYIVPGEFRSVSQAKTFDWPFLAVWTVAGLIGVWCSERTGFPAMLQPGISNVRRFLLPALAGLGFGALAILVDRQSGWSTVVAARHDMSSIHIPFPASVLIYPGGAVIVEVVHRLFPIPVLLWLFSNVFFRGKWQEQTFWVIAILLAAAEPATQYSRADGIQWALNLVAAQDYAMNLYQCYLFRRYGFLASLTVRVAFYLIWHVAGGPLEQLGVGA